MRDALLTARWLLRSFEAMARQAFTAKNMEKPPFESPYKALAKVLEEAGEVAACVNKGAPPHEFRAECGDLLWTTAMLYAGTEKEISPRTLTHEQIMARAVLLYAVLVEFSSMSSTEFARSVGFAQEWYRNVRPDPISARRAMHLFNEIDTHRLKTKPENAG
jgi:NTP pyrophosphatase (non-canonical NTP hydrolase)